MIRTLTFTGRLDGKDGEAVAEAIRTEVASMVRKRNTIKGATVTVEGDVVYLGLRVWGLDRWRIAGEARKIASFLLAVQRVSYSRPLHPVQEVTEQSARNLTAEQGRTPQSVLGGRGRRRTAPPEVPWVGDALPR